MDDSEHNIEIRISIQTLNLKIKDQIFETFPSKEVPARRFSCNNTISIEPGLLYKQQKLQKV